MAGKAQLHGLIGGFLGEDADECDVRIGIETNRGPRVTALLAAGYRSTGRCKSVIWHITVSLARVVPTCAVRLAIVPALWAFTGCSIFIASRTRTRSPTLTCCPSETQRP